RRGEQKAPEPLLVGQRMGDRDRSPRAVAEEVEGKLRMTRAGKAHEGVDVGDGVVHAVDRATGPRRAAMAPVVKLVGGEARRGEPGGDVAVAPGVLADAMSDDDHGTRLLRRQPRL